MNYLIETYLLHYFGYRPDPNGHKGWYSSPEMNHCQCSRLYAIGQATTMFNKKIEEKDSRYGCSTVKWELLRLLMRIRKHNR